MGSADQPSDAALFVKICDRLWGPAWGAEVARALQLNPRTVQRLKRAVGEGRGYPLNPRVLGDLAALLRQRAAQEAAWAGQLEAAAGEAEAR